MNASSVPSEIIIAPQKIGDSASFSRRKKEGFAQPCDKIVLDIVSRPVHIKTTGVLVHQATGHHITVLFGIGDEIREKTHREPARFRIIVDDVHQRELLAGT